MGVKKLIKNVGVKGIFNAVFPKAENTKIGRLASGIVKGATHATPLSFFQDFLKEFLDADGDGKITVKDFRELDIKTVGTALGFLAVLLAMLLLYNRYFV